MPELAFQVRGAEALLSSLAPAIALELEVAQTGSNATPEPPAEIQTILLNTQIQIEAARHHYTPPEKPRLRDLFGEPERWRETMHPLIWTTLTTAVPQFEAATTVKLALPCTFDFQIAVTKYFHALEGGVPLTLLFSGTIFYRNGGPLQAAPIPWKSEARFELPAAVWKQAMDAHYPNTAWLALRRDVFERLYQYKAANSLATFDDAIEHAMEARA